MMLNITQKKGSISSVILNEKEIERETGSWLLDLEKEVSSVTFQGHFLLL